MSNVKQWKLTKVTDWILITTKWQDGPNGHQNKLQEMNVIVAIG